MPKIPPLLQISPRITALPIIHGSGQCALIVRRWMLEHKVDCVALPLPESFREPVETAVLELPRPAIVIQPPREKADFEITEWSAENEHGFFGSDDSDDEDEDEDEDDELRWWPQSYVPIDPCQPVIMGIRAALGEHVPRAYIDLETEQFLPESSAMPDPYALRTVSPERFAAALLPSITPPARLQTQRRVEYMAMRLRELEQHYENILLICCVSQWPWIRAAYHGHAPWPTPAWVPHQRQTADDRKKADGDTSQQNRERAEDQADQADAEEDEFADYHIDEIIIEQLQSIGEDDDLEDDLALEEDGDGLDVEPPSAADMEEPVVYPVEPRTLVFLFGELPFISALYERARAELEEDDNIQIDGVKELLIAAREAYYLDLGKRARRITPFALSQALKYIRNLSLLGKRMTPDLYTIVTAAKQIFGDQYALSVVETARDYAYSVEDNDEPAVALAIDQGRLPTGDIVPLVSRLAGPTVLWQSIQLNRRPTDDERARWGYKWNPFGQCSYPPEDEHIERFRSRAFDRARAIMGADLARTEKFTTSVKDGIDIRDTVRHWYEKQIYVKVIPPDRGTLDACVMLFDSPADPRDYPWRTTWFAEHNNESTLAFYATDFRQELVGPGICLATYGGAMFLFPPKSIPDIWSDPRLDFVETLEERLIAAACMYSRSRQVALLSSLPPGGGWRRLARRFKKQLIHVPLSGFSEAEVSQLRMVHVLNGTEVRSYAEHFIRKS
ncbi:hypothetical protein SH139x_002887 [Planctomycetaceae bacterium SH139]